MAEKKAASAKRKPKAETAGTPEHLGSAQPSSGEPWPTTRPARIRAAVILDAGISAVEPEAEPSAPAHVHLTSGDARLRLDKRTTLQVVERAQT
jgi:hypothetical protein